jgi:hypothetical protein
LISTGTSVCGYNAWTDVVNCSTLSVEGRFMTLRSVNWSTVVDVGVGLNCD